MTTTSFTVITQHGVERTVRRQRFTTYEKAEAYATAHNPDTDSSMVPQLDEKLAHHPDYERGFYFAKVNKYAVMTKKGNRQNFR